MLPVCKRVAGLCLVLILWSAVAFAVHHHADGDESAQCSAQCSVCLAALTAAPAQLAIPPQTTLLAVASVETPSESAAKQRLATFALAVRPPPEL